MPKNSNGPNRGGFASKTRCYIPRVASVRRKLIVLASCAGNANKISANAKFTSTVSIVHVARDVIVRRKSGTPRRQWFSLPFSFSRRRSERAGLHTPGSRQFVKSAKGWVEGSFYRDRTDHPSPKVTCTAEGSLPCLEVMGGLGARFA